MSPSASRTTGISGTRSSLVGDVRQARNAGQQIGLVGIAGQHHGRAPAQPRQQHLDLGIGAVLRLIDHHKTFAQGAAAHIGDRRDLDDAVGQHGFEPLGAQPLGQRVVERAQIGRQLFLQVAGQEAQAFAGFHRGARQHDALTLPASSASTALAMAR